MPSAQWRVLAKSHDARNLAEYEGHSHIDQKLFAELIQNAAAVEALVIALK
jgi:hypothetical protein